MQVATEPRPRPAHRHGLAPKACTIREACHVTGLGKTSIYELINQGKLQSVAIGRRRLVLVESIEALLRPSVQ
jgi:excisionase family DNA binding protein